MNKLTITPTSANDIPDLQAILSGTGLFPPDMLAPLLAPALAGETEAFWLTCHTGGSAVGFCYTQPEELTDGTWNMLALAVLPARQGQGIGSALVKAAEDHLRDRGQRLIIVDTSGSEDFALTRQFYVQCGYDEEARIRDFWAAGDDKVIFRKAL